jgi:hypothetical protein
MGFGFRRSAVTYRVPCITTVSGARVRYPIRVWSLQEIRAKTVA